MSREELVTELCKPTVESMGYEWWGVEYHHNSHNAILRIYVDNPNGGISMEDVVAVTEQINPLLDVEDPIKTMYTLEVSSPGVDRPLYTIEQFARYIGQPVKLNAHQAIQGQRKFTGEIAEVDVDAGTVELVFTHSKEQQRVTLEFTNIDKARLVPVFED
ncbi:ribosome maturation factor RimP [Cardiobacteriaceae bacterium TAE3-ERU3]|nr:ribosome maturation factor RimP [Cardiobacteriaceae bacterium TAE3-ERU3]